MEKQVKLYPSDNFKNEFYCNIAAWCHLESKKEGKQNIGWYRIRLNNSFVRFQAIHIRAIEVIEDNNYDTWFFKNRKFIRYEVKPNPWRIEFLEPLGLSLSPSLPVAHCLVRHIVLPVSDCDRFVRNKLRVLPAQ